MLTRKFFIREPVLKFSGSSEIEFSIGLIVDDGVTVGSDDGDKNVTVSY